MSSIQYGIYNGDVLPTQDISVPITDAGFLYGYGVFESIGVFGGKIPLLPRHYARLEQSALVMDIPVNVSVEEFESQVNALIQKNEIENGVINWYLSAGDRWVDEGRMVFGTPRYWITTRPSQSLAESPSLSVSVRDVSYSRTGLDQYKTLSYIKPVLESIHCMDDEAILVDQDGQVLEGIFSNVFFVIDNAIVTPRSNGILPGVMRDIVIDLAQADGISVNVQQIDKIQIEQFDEVFLSNAVKGIIPVKSVTDVPDLKSGPVTDHLRSLLKQHLYATH